VFVGEADLRARLLAADSAYPVSDFELAIASDREAKVAVVLLNGGSVEPSVWRRMTPVVNARGGRNWFRASVSERSDSVLALEVIVPQSGVILAYRTPYANEDYEEFVTALGEANDVAIRNTPSNGESPIVVLGSEVNARGAVWVLARQHPGESPGSFVLEGLASWLSSPDSAARQIRAQYIFVFAGMMNPGGVAAGRFRTDTDGIDIATTWKWPSSALPPMVGYVRAAICAMQRTVPLIALVDLHAHSSINANFLLWTTRRDGRTDDLATRIVEAFANATPDFSLNMSRPVSPNGSRSASAFASQLGGVGMVVEVSYQDLAHMGRPGDFMNVGRYRHFGRQLGASLAAVLLTTQPHMRDAARGNPLSDQGVCA
jgi:hypothetical protein